MTSDLKIANRLIQTADGTFTLMHEEHGQTYHSSEGARFEAVNLYIEASGIKERWRDCSNDGKSIEPISVLDVGLGLAYNACATISSWLEEKDSVSVEMMSLEIDANLVTALISGEALWLSGWEESWLSGIKLLQKVDQFTYTALIKHAVSNSCFRWTIKIGDAALLQWSTKSHYDFIWQDPFTPDLNSSLWSKAWFDEIRKRSKSSAVLMTYSVSRQVRDALIESGWQPARITTPGRKRHWLRATLKT